MGKEKYGPAVLRVFLGLLMLVPGLMKLMDPSMPTAMLAGIGFPLPQVWAWILLLSEIIFGLCVIVGLKVQWTVWPLFVVMVVAIVTVVLPGVGAMGPVTLLFHLLALAGFASLALTGPGALAVSKK